MPSRAIALLLAFVGPWGIGHFYLGRRARGIAWLAIAIGGLFVFALLIRTLGPRIGWGLSLALPILVMGIVWVASLVDLSRVRDTSRVVVWQILVFVAAGIVAPLIASALL